MKYFPQLDALRSIAVFAVLLQHFFSEHTIQWGFYGVRLFYVLSGFLITTVILNHKMNMEESGISIFDIAKNFYIRRTLRLFPIYYLTLCAVLVTSTFYPINNISGLKWHFLYLSNYYIFSVESWIGKFSHFWSLSVEEQFYFFWFWIAIFLKTRHLALTTLFIIFASPAFRFLSYAFGYSRFSDLLLFGCLDILGMGCLLAIVHHEVSKNRFIRIKFFFSDNRRMVNLFILFCACTMIYVMSAKGPANISTRILLIFHLQLFLLGLYSKGL